jgi:DeoR/GlpR family transcriptional regulator of sugar metabolism
MMALHQKQNYRLDELAEAASVSLRTVRRWLRLDLVKHVHFLGVIRIPREEYERVLREGIRRANPVRERTR